MTFARLLLLSLSTLFITFQFPHASSHEQHTDANKLNADSGAVPPVTDFPQSTSRQITGGPFNLVSHMGQKVSDGDFKGSYLLIYFGYSYCPDICPADLAVMGRALDLLGDGAAKIQPLFITFDPDRDTEEHLASYIKNFHPRLIALTGTREQTLVAANHYGVDVSATYKAELPGSAYSMNHSAFTYLVDSDRKLRVMFRNGTSPQLMANTILRHLEE